MNSSLEGQSKSQNAEGSYHHTDQAVARGEGWVRQARRPRRARGDVESRNRVVQAHLGLVYRVARQFLNRGLTIEDLVGEGNLGLIRAAQEYDPAKGTRFSTYATYWIREAIQSALANTAATIRLPMHVSKLMRRWRRTEKLLLQRWGHPPTFEDVAKAMGLDRPTQRLVAKAHRVAQLQRAAADCGDGASRTLLMPDEGLTAEESLSAQEERESVSRRLQRLGVTERTVVLLKYGLAGEPPMTFQQIGGRLGMTAAAVQKVISAAMRKLGRRTDARDVHGGHVRGSRVG
jgi:RNA polymerase primary sigma factor